MKAVIYENFQGPLSVTDVKDPEPAEHGVVMAIEATGICRSDWHGWMGHDSDISLPHIPGHEFAGTIEEVGKSISNSEKGDRVTMPFMGVCGSCSQCTSGYHHLCNNRFYSYANHVSSFAYHSKPNC